jgi:hypothetical protein
MKVDLVADVDQSVDEYDEYQHEVSNAMANDFLDERILPQLQEFDFSNANVDYIPGIATFCLFTKLLIELINTGYTVDDIKTMVDDMSQYCVVDTVH